MTVGLVEILMIQGQTGPIPWMFFLWNIHVRDRGISERLL